MIGVCSCIWSAAAPFLLQRWAVFSTGCMLRRCVNIFRVCDFFHTILFFYTSVIWKLLKMSTHKAKCLQLNCNWCYRRRKKDSLLCVRWIVWARPTQMNVPLIMQFMYFVFTVWLLCGYYLLCGYLLSICCGLCPVGQNVGVFFKVIYFLQSCDLNQNVLGTIYSLYIHQNPCYEPIF